MLFNELVHALGTSIACMNRLGDDLHRTIRADFGCVIIASMFGGRVEQVEDNPPWIRTDEGFDIYKRFRDYDPLDFARGWCPRVVARYRFYRDALTEYTPSGQAGTTSPSRPSRTLRHGRAPTGRRDLR